MTYGLLHFHGGVGAIEMFGPVLSLLAEGRQVIAVDLQAHGRTADIERPLRFELMADDIATLIEHLGFESADVMGYSLGGGVALQIAIQHPEVVRKLILVSTPFKRDGWYPEVLVRTSHAVELFELLGGGKADAGWDGSGMSNAQLANLPATTHYDIFSSPTLASTVTPFLDTPMPKVN